LKHYKVLASFCLLFMPKVAENQQRTLQIRDYVGRVEFWKEGCKQGMLTALCHYCIGISFTCDLTARL